MPNKSTDTKLGEFKRRAEESAKARRERVTSAHLLAAIAGEDGPAARLLTERGLSDERLLRAARASTDEIAEPVRDALAHAKEVAERMRAPDVDAVHLLIALVSHRGFAAHRALEQCGVDVSRLRIAAMNAGLGRLGRRPITTGRASEPVTAAAPQRLKSAAVSIPLLQANSGRKRLPPLRLGHDHEEGVPQSPSSKPSGTSLAVRRLGPETISRHVTSPRHAKKRARPRFKLDKKKFPTLTALGRNLTLAAERGELDPVIGRDAEVQQALDILAKRQANNPCLVGAAGVGKTSVVRAMALSIAAGEDVSAADEKIIIEVPISELFAGTGVRGALAERLGNLRKEVAASEGRVVLFFDEIHQLFRADASDEVVGELKLLLARGQLPCIGATTREEYQRAIGADSALERRFTTVDVDEPGRGDAYLMLDAMAEKLGLHHQVKYQEEALALSIAWTVQYVQGRALPDKALSVIDLAGARARRRGETEVTPESVAEVVSELADVPVERLLEADADRMLRLEELMAERVVGHADKLQKVASVIRRNAVGLGGQRPIGTFLLLGPTGVGKTETAKAIAEAMFFSDAAMTRLDMSEFSESHSVARLIGSPPGYVGHDAGGQLTEAIRRRPYQVLLLDEIEKAHPEVLETFLSVFDEGRLTDSRGKLVDFTNTVILLTSNIGAHLLTGPRSRRVGFGASDGETSAQEGRLKEEARKRLSPELYNRIDEVLMYRPLSREEVAAIAHRLIERLALQMEIGRAISVRATTSAVEYLLDNGGFEPELGARPLKRTIARLVEGPLAEAILRGELQEGMGAFIEVLGSRLTVSCRAVPEPVAAE